MIRLVMPDAAALVLCTRESLPLDFFSWHCYTDNPAELAARPGPCAACSTPAASPKPKATSTSGIICLVTRGRCCRARSRPGCASAELNKYSRLPWAGDTSIEVHVVDATHAFELRRGGKLTDSQVLLNLPPPSVALLAFRPHAAPE